MMSVLSLVLIGVFMKPSVGGGYLGAKWRREWWSAQSKDQTDVGGGDGWNQFENRIRE